MRWSIVFFERCSKIAFPLFELSNFPVFYVSSDFWVHMKEGGTYWRE
jgi:hypothetical protein